MAATDSQPAVSTVTNPTTEIPPGSLPKFSGVYAGLGVKTGYDPRKPTELRLDICGPTGQGKTTFISSIPDTLVLDFEDGARAVADARCARVHITNTKELNPIIDQLVKDGENKKWPCKRICFDTVDEMSEMLGGELARERGVMNIAEYKKEGAGWFLLRDLVWSYIARLEAVGYYWTTVAHLVEKQTTDVVTKQLKTIPRPALFRTLASKIVRNCDIHGTVYCRTMQEPEFKEVKMPGGAGTQRVQIGTIDRPVYYLDLVPTGALRGKARGIPPIREKIELSAKDGWQAFVKIYDEAVKKMRMPK